MTSNESLNERSFTNKRYVGDSPASWPWALCMASAFVRQQLLVKDSAMIQSQTGSVCTFSTIRTEYWMSGPVFVLSTPRACFCCLHLCINHAGVVIAAIIVLLITVGMSRVIIKNNFTEMIITQIFNSITVHHLHPGFTVIQTQEEDLCFYPCCPLTPLPAGLCLMCRFPLPFINQITTSHQLTT